MKITISKTTEFEAVYLKVDAGVRYWEDAEVNGVSDSEIRQLFLVLNLSMPIMNTAGDLLSTSTMELSLIGKKVLPHKFTIRYAMMAFIQLLIKMATSLLSMRVTFHPSCARKMKDMATTSL